MEPMTERYVWNKFSHRSGRFQSSMISGLRHINGKYKDFEKIALESDVL